MDDEYVVLLSQPGHSKSEFSTKLGKEFHFSADNQSYVGLKEISFPRALKSQHLVRDGPDSKDKIRLAVEIPYLTGKKFKEIDIDEGYYSTQNLVDLINERLKAILGIKFESGTCCLVYNSIIDRIEIAVNGEDLEESRRVSLLIFPPLAVYLGLSKNKKEYFLFGAETSLLPGIKSKHKIHGIATYSPLMTSYELIFIYLDILKHQVSVFRCAGP